MPERAEHLDQSPAAGPASPVKISNRGRVIYPESGLTKGEHQIEGINSRLDGMQAAILSVKLRHLDAWTQARRDKAASYNARLAGIVGLETPVEGEGCEHVYHLYVVRHDRRDELAAHLAAAGIQTVVNYPVALPFLPAYQRFGHVPRDFPNAWANQGRILSLPIFPEMHASQQAHVAEALHRFAEMRPDKSNKT